MSSEHASLLSKTIFDPAYNRLIALLADARRRARIPQAELADRLRRPQSYVSKYERGERRLDVLEFVCIAQALGLKASSLIAELEKDLAHE